VTEQILPPRSVADRLLAPRNVGIAAVVLGVLGVWLTLPPFTVRSPGPVAVLGVLAGLGGIWAITRGERKLGWWAVTLAVAGTAGALWVQTREQDTLEAVISTGLAAATLRWATPLAFAALGGIFSERSGVVNIGLEGMMLMGAFFGVWGADLTSSWVGGLVVAMLAGGALAFVHAVFSIHLRADQIVSGTAVNFLALGITGYLFRDVYGEAGTPTDLDRIPDVSVPGLRDMPFLGDVVGEMSIMIWLMLLLVVVAHVVIFRTPAGLRLRAVGEHPRAADTVGIPVYRVRYIAVTVSGVLAALGGAYLSVGFIGTFNENMTLGRGFIALAAVIFGAWRPFGALGACLLFGFSSGLAQRLDTEAAISGNLLQALPYVLTLIALVGVIGRTRAPAAVGRPYAKG
jgi:ABC-type uncharacterized transport system permease subunit